MPVIDVEALAAPLDPEAPCGEDLTYDTGFLELDRLAQGTPEQVMGDETIPAQQPDWSDVASRAVELLGRSRDLRVTMYLVLAALELEGLSGLRDGLALVRRLLETHWEHLFPQLDPEDDNDPTERINVIEAIAQPEGSFGDPMRFIHRLREAPLTDSRQLGRFSHRDLLIAAGELPWPDDAEGDPPTTALIDGAFEDTPTDWLQQEAQAAAEANEHINAIDTFLVDTVGADRAAQLDPFKKTLADVAARLSEQLARRGYSAPQVGEVAEAAAPGAPAQALTGNITCAEDVVRTIDKICKYYEKHEPSSPVPLLLRRAQRLVAKSFVEVMQDLSPQAMQQIEIIAGIDTAAQQ